MIYIYITGEGINKPYGQIADSDHFISEEEYKNSKKNNVENSDMKELAEKRLTRLVNMAIPLLKEASDLYPNVKKFKRTTVIHSKLMEHWNSIFIKKGIFKEGQKCIYTPNVDTYNIYYNAYQNREVLIEQIYTKGDNRPRDGYPEFCDCPTSEKCHYMVSVKVSEQNVARRFFWTTENCLKLKK